MFDHYIPRLLTVVGILAWSLLAIPACSQEKTVPENVVAAVNDAFVSRTDFDREFNRLKTSMAQAGQPVDESQTAEIETKALDNLIYGELLYQESGKQGIEITDSDLEAKLSTLKERFGSEENFAKALAQMSLNEEEVKIQVRRGMAVERLVDREVVQKTTVAGQEVKAFYDEHPDLFKQPEQVQASHILIAVGAPADQAQKDKARQKIEGIQYRLKNGEDFAVLAREASDCPSKEKGGELDYLTRGQTVKPFEDAAFALEPGRMSDIVETDFGYHIIKVTDKKPETVLPYEEVQDKLQEYLKQNKVKENVNQYMAAFKEKAEIKVYLKEAPQEK